MSELTYGDFRITPTALAIEDVLYDWCPSGFHRLAGADGIRSESVATLGLNRQIVTPSPLSEEQWFTFEKSNVHDESRLLVNQSWTVEWTNAVTDLCLRDHLYLLYSLQKGFWMMYDEEQSRTCCVLEPINSSRKVYLTPTYPIAFYRHSDLSGQRQEEHLYLQIFFDGEPVRWSQHPWRCDPNNGMIVFNDAVPQGVVVTVSYLWRAYVRVREVELIVKDLAQVAYVGSATFEQLRPPPFVERFDDRWSLPPCRDIELDNGFSDGRPDILCANPVNASRADSVTRLDQVGGVPWVVEWSVDDATYSATTASAGISKFLNLNNLEFNVPDILGRSPIAVVVEITFGSVTGTVLMDVCRFDKAGTLIGPNGTNLALLTTGSTVAYGLDLETSGIRYADFVNNALSLNIGLIFQTAGNVTIENVKITPCFEDIGEVDSIGLLCGVKQLRIPHASLNVQTTTCVGLHYKPRYTGIQVPTGSFVSGLDVGKLVAGCANGSSTDRTSEVDVKARLLHGSSSFSSARTKTTQPIIRTDHAIYNYRTGQTKPSYGGPNDLWGRPFGVWTPAQINSLGIELDVDWSTEDNPSDPANWDITYHYDGSTETFSTGDTPNSTATDWNQTVGAKTGAPGHAGAPAWVRVAGSVTITYTWVGVGNAPSKIKTTTTSNSTSSSHTGTLDNGIGSGIVNAGDGQEANGTYTEVLPVNSGIATKIVTVLAYAYYPATTNGIPTASINVSGEIADCTFPIAEDSEIIVYYSPVCALAPAVFQKTTDTEGSITSLMGEGGGILRTSDGTVVDDFVYTFDQFDIPVLPGNCRITGMKLEGQYRAINGVVRVETLVASIVIGSTPSGSDRTLDYPVSSEWQDFQLGGSTDRWGYESSSGSELGTVYPTALGSQVNSAFHVQLGGSNELGHYYEFKHLTVTLYVAEVGDGF